MSTHKFSEALQRFSASEQRSLLEEAKAAARAGQFDRAYEILGKVRRMMNDAVSAARSPSGGGLKQPDAVAASEWEAAGRFVDRAESQAKASKR